MHRNSAYIKPTGKKTPTTCLHLYKRRIQQARLGEKLWSINCVICVIGPGSQWGFFALCCSSFSRFSFLNVAPALFSSAYASLSSSGWPEIVHPSNYAGSATWPGHARDTGDVEFSVRRFDFRYFHSLWILFRCLVGARKGIFFFQAAASLLFSNFINTNNDQIHPRFSPAFSSCLQAKVLVKLEKDKIRMFSVILLMLNSLIVLNQESQSWIQILKWGPHSDLLMTLETSNHQGDSCVWLLIHNEIIQMRNGASEYTHRSKHAKAFSRRCRCWFSVDDPPVFNFPSLHLSASFNIGVCHPLSWVLSITDVWTQWSHPSSVCLEEKGEKKYCVFCVNARERGCNLHIN